MNKLKICSSNASKMLKQEQHNALYKYLLMLVGISLPLNIHINVACIVLLFVNWLLEGDFRNKINTLKESPFALLSIALFIWICIQLLLTDDANMGRFAIEKKGALLIIPLIIHSKKYLFKKFLGDFLRAFTIGIIDAMLFCFAMALWHYSKDHQSNHLVYHQLASGLQQSAIYMSLLCMLAATFLIYNLTHGVRGIKIINIIMLSFLCLCILLLSSKLHIVVFFTLGIIIIYPVFKKQKLVFIGGIILLITMLLVGIFTNNSIKRRYADIHLDRLQMLQQQQYSRDVYFDGLALRLVFIRFGYEILNENHAWVLGVSPGNNQNLLNQKIVDYHLYTGDTKAGNTGYLNYEYHNQYMETLVGCGLIGLSILIALLFVAYKNGRQNKHTLLMVYTSIFSICFLTESMLEMEIGIVSFTLFLSLLSLYSPATSEVAEPIQYYA